MLEPAAATVPKRSSFPGSASIKHENGSIIESGKRIAADGMSEVMIYESKLCLASRQNFEETASRRHLGDAWWQSAAIELRRQDC